MVKDSKGILIFNVFNDSQFVCVWSCRKLHLNPGYTAITQLVYECNVVFLWLPVDPVGPGPLVGVYRVNLFGEMLFHCLQMALDWQWQ